MVFLALGRRSVSLIALCALFATVGSGCVPPDSEQFRKPVASTSGVTEPVVLNGAGGKISAPGGKIAARNEPAVSAAASPPTDPSATGVASPAAPASAPILAAK